MRPLTAKSASLMSWLAYLPIEVYVKTKGKNLGVKHVLSRTFCKDYYLFSFFSFKVRNKPFKMTSDKISSIFVYHIIIIIFVSNSNVEATNSCLEEWLKKLSTQLKVGRSSEPVVVSLIWGHSQMTSSPPYCDSSFSPFFLYVRLMK